MLAAAMVPSYEWPTGEPDAVKAASPVREGAVGKGPLRWGSCREADDLLRNLAGRLLHSTTTKAPRPRACPSSPAPARRLHKRWGADWVPFSFWCNGWSWPTLST